MDDRDHQPDDSPDPDDRAFDPHYCPNCGVELLPPGNFCSNCGTAVADPASSVEDPAGRDADPGRSREANAPGPTDDRSGDRPAEGGGPRDGADRRSVGGQTGEDSTGEGHTGDNSTGETDEQFRRRVEDWIHRGWSVETDDGDRVVLVNRDLGNAWVHLGLLVTTVWFTSGIVNLGYALWSYFGSPDRVTLHRNAPGGPDGPASERRRTDDRVRVGGASSSVPPVEPGAPSADPAADPESTTDEESSDPGRPFEGLDTAVGALLALIAAGILVLGGASVGSLAIAAAVLVAAGACFPSVRRRFRPAYPVSTVGRTRSTEERSVRDPGRPCTVCHSPVERGVERTYREEFVVAGVPVATTEEGRNYYCEDCSTTVPPAGGAESLGRPAVTDLDDDPVQAAETGDEDPGTDADRDDSAPEADDGDGDVDAGTDPERARE